MTVFPVDTSGLYAKRKELRNQLTSIGYILKGSIVELRMCCGKPNCRCKRGQKHITPYLSTHIAGESRRIYLSPTRKKDAAEWVENYHKVHEIINKLSKINAEILKRRKPR